MKKNIFISLILSTVINGVCFLINFICANLFHFLPLAISVGDGEWIGTIGFGVLLEKLYSLSSGGESSVSYYVSYDFFSIFVSFILIFIIIFLLKKFFIKKW